MAAASRWRPRPEIRVLALGLPRRGDGAEAEILVSPVRDDDGGVTGWRPIGGGIEFGERAEAALRREFWEEYRLVVGVGARICVLENLFEHGGAPGHEVALVHEARLETPGAYDAPRFEPCEPGPAEAIWVRLDAFRSHAETLFPSGLLDAVV